MANLNEIAELIKATIGSSDTSSNSTIYRYINLACKILGINTLRTNYVVDYDSETITPDPDGDDTAMIVMQSSITILQDEITNSASSGTMIRTGEDTIDTRGRERGISGLLSSLRADMRALKYDYIMKTQRGILLD